MTTIFDVLRRPLITEKSNYQSGKLNQYTFEVASNATRGMVKDAIELIYDVNVTRVNIVNAPAKRGRRAKSRRLLVRKSGFKKAIVTLVAGQTIDAFGGVQ
ncbi:MAG: 50S ribosomal protein L23 [Anaerolineae bacterium CFX3]|nr:50S ribosomal protein L23 [Anaerolineae bacterium CFX3]MCQ3945969.1 50S ribosomal protein L23 [Anaerolineae bacterium]RIK26843.1 MAG: 50S ribosomal protein L23 [Anaerolineae bacterium]